MKSFTKFSLAYAIQLMGVIILFSYGSCSTNEGPKTDPPATISVASESAKFSKPAVELKAAMHKLWEDHITWTRNVILCIADGLPGADQAVNRLLQNQTDIGNAIKTYYGEDAGNRLTGLLKIHITTAAEVVKAAKAGNTAALEEANKRWGTNADDISVFLNNANPNWELTEMKMMMNDHLKLTTDEAVQRIKKDYDADIIAYDKVHVEILKMADMLSDGIVKQFPEKFKAVSK